jgi:hypothetical protein
VSDPFGLRHLEARQGRQRATKVKPSVIDSGVAEACVSRTHVNYCFLNLFV